MTTKTATKRRIQLLGTVDGQDHPVNGHYIVSYDPEAHQPDGSYDGGLLVTTEDPAKAAVFELADAIALWRSGPTCECHRVRADGRPNRPLTAFNTEIS